MQRYLDFLSENLDKPCLLTGIEDFKWEEKFVFGYGSQGEYKKLKQTRASYRDTFELVAFEKLDDCSNIFVKVKRVADKKKFSLQLFELKAVDEKSKNYQLLDDYSVWITNYLQEF